LPAGQAPTQEPAAQLAVPPAGAAQACPQAPQLAASDRVSTQNAPQRTVPVAQVGRHAPATQTSDGGHPLPQAPQLARSIRTSTQVVPQPVSGAAQVGVPAQAPATHDCPARQARPQPPQWAALERTSTSQPSAASWSQSAKPAPQAKAQAPAAQAGVALGRGGHAVPQAPQLVALVAVSTSQPLAAPWSQSARPGRHAPRPHAPARHAAVAPAGAGHAVPQAPQWAALAEVSTHAPAQHAAPEGQGREAEQPATQRLLVHTWPAAQWASVTHCSQVFRAASQRGVGVPKKLVSSQSASAPQPYSQRFITASQ